jgi:hypothetical protein
MITRDFIVREAERYGFEVKGFEPGPGTCAEVVLLCQQTERLATIGIYPYSTESDLGRLFRMAAAELRPPPPLPPGPHAWLS